jgi:hypothetical protein
MNEEELEDRHAMVAAKRAREEREEATKVIILKAKELASLMTDLGDLGIKCEVEFYESHTTPMNVIGNKPDLTPRFTYYPKVIVSEPAVILGQTPPEWVR